MHNIKANNLTAHLDWMGFWAEYCSWIASEGNLDVFIERHGEVLHLNVEWLTSFPCLNRSFQQEVKITEKKKKKKELAWRASRFSKKKGNREPRWSISFEFQMNEKRIWTICTLCFHWQYYLQVIRFTYYTFATCVFIGGFRYHGEGKLLKKKSATDKRLLEAECVKNHCVPEGVTHAVCGVLGDWHYHWNTSMHVWVSSSRRCLPKDPRRERWTMLGSDVRKSARGRTVTSESFGTWLGCPSILKSLYCTLLMNND